VIRGSLLRNRRLAVAEKFMLAGGWTEHRRLISRFLQSVITSMISLLILTSAVIAVGICICAWRGKLHIPGYIGLAFLAFGVALIVGRISGARGVTGTHFGLLLSVLFFLLMAVAVSSILALFFYRHPPQT
jgi:hypothetical protein